MPKQQKQGFVPRMISGALVLAVSAGIAACNTDRTTTGSLAVPFDHRERHPIRLVEGESAIQLLVGTARGELTADQRAQVTQMASEWRREGTGRIVIEVPKGTANARAAAYAAREAQSLLRASGVPPRAVVVKSYQTGAESFGPVRLAYARIEAEAGPCGAWPEDLGAAPFPSMQRMPANFDNRPYWNLGCASQQNLAAMVANPEDLVQPRASTLPVAARRQAVMERYRKGENPSGQYETKDATVKGVAQ